MAFPALDSWSPGTRSRGVAMAAFTLLSLLTSLLSGCEGCLPERGRRFGSTCGKTAECSSGVCYQGYCTTSCKDSSTCEGGVCIEQYCRTADGDMDNDGLTNAYEAKFGLDPSTSDSDSDGRPDVTEIGADSEHPLDSNGDGIIDAAQSNTLDSDGDCMVDAIDSAPVIPDSALPPASALCTSGVCAGQINQVQVVCSNSAPTPHGLALGCTGCVCQAPGLPDWQVVEALCDTKDNDCDGETDEDLTYGGLPLGSPCQTASGICALTPDFGVVECGSDQVVTCSTAANGSQSLAKTETCNLMDDDCDGTTDNGFTFKDKVVGNSCGECGFSPVMCPSGLPANPPVVTCSSDGTEAVCAGLPFASGFTDLSVGAPQPRPSWSAAFSPQLQRIWLYGGEVPGAKTLVARADLWSLDVSGSAQSAPTPAQWELSTAAPPGPRVDAALVWDADGGRLILVGGRSGSTMAQSVWAYQYPNSWAEASAGQAATYIAALPPLGAATANTPPAQAVVLKGGAAGRVLLLFPGAGPSPYWHALNGIPGWVGVSGDPMPAQAHCVAAAPDGSFAWAITPSGAYRLEIPSDGSTPVATQIALAGENTVTIPGVQCAIDDAGQLHVFGGHNGAGQHLPHLIGTQVGGQLSFAAATGLGAIPDLPQRSFGLGAWNQASQSLIVAGGYRVVAQGAVLLRSGLSDVWSWSTSDAVPARLDRKVPVGRIGHVSGWSTKRQALCITSGLRFDLPTQGSSVTRLLPATDAWCYTDAKGWQIVTDQAPASAFGIGAMDVKTDRLVLAGGLPVVAGQPVANVARLWEGKLLTAGVLDASWAPIATVTHIDLESGVTSVASSPKAPALAAATQVLDPLRNRLLLFGGFDATSETQEFFAFDLATLVWTDLGAQLIGNQRPAARYGATALYDPYRDVLALAAGSLRLFDQDGKPTGIGKDIVTLKKFDCVGHVDTTLWTTRTLQTPGFQPMPLPTYADFTVAPPQQELLRPYFGGPVFYPMLFDPLGGRGWMSVPSGVNETTDSLGQACPGPTTAQPLVAGVQMVFDVGSCSATQPFVARLAATAVSPSPSALMLATALHIEKPRRSYVWSGLEADSTVSSALWRLDQTCAP
jgi:hypothetical protein